jgi:hypothetical protein
MPRSVGSSAAIRLIIASSSPIIDTVLPSDKLNPSPIRIDPYSVLLCIVMPIAISAQATRNMRCACGANRGSRDEPNAAAAVMYSKKIVISDTETRQALT